MHPHGDAPAETSPARRRPPVAAARLPCTHDGLHLQWRAASALQPYSNPQQPRIDVCRLAMLLRDAAHRQSAQLATGPCPTDIVASLAFAENGGAKPATAARSWAGRTYTEQRPAYAFKHSGLNASERERACANPSVRHMDVRGRASSGRRQQHAVQVGVQSFMRVRAQELCQHARHITASCRAMPHCGRASSQPLDHRLEARIEQRATARRTSCVVDRPALT
jgi:hypothetical protein